MTESHRRGSEHESPRTGGHEPHSSPVDPDRPAPPAYAPGRPGYAPDRPATAAHPTAPAAPVTAPDPLAAPDPMTATRPVSAGHPAEPADPLHAAGPAAPRPRRKRDRGPVALLAAVAIVAAAVGGGTAYGVQELTGGSTVASAGPAGTSVVPAGRKGTVAGVAEAVGPSIVEINAESNAGSSTGSGVIITDDGEVVTNNHVIAGASSVEVRTGDGKTYTADVVGTESSKDLALIKLRDASGLTAATLGDSDGVRVGDEVVAIGSPEGLTGTVTSGIVSALDRDVTVSTDESRGQRQGQPGGWPFEFDGREFNGDTGGSTTTYEAIQTDASLNPGNSGGALIDMNGDVIGINSAMYASSGGDSSPADAGSVGLGFAIPVDTVKADLPALRSGSMD
ncbi:S1C family serine protease [Streptomyces prasinopilosus]|uniref:Trypsin-like peptidase domain-containing protein n=1 Tax=Streptomyces prasinopilosus TaxID=67344 RepID=A0A1G6QA58_9ACTN|nr:trypsin-like peptidase domain-containing protein [Streptomyces prasinopilosus]SDC89188.1 Trypsin-like peptidase domain-containing protein [Streptomyces prasinopilosus]